MALLLEVPYEEKDEAKLLGAKWNASLKKWYVSDPKSYDKFRKWLDDKTIICNYLYIVEGKRICWKCKRETTVIALAIKDYYENDYDEMSKQYHYRWRTGSMCLIEDINSIPEKLQEYLDKIYNFKKRYSYTVKDKYLANGCQFCNALQGNQYLFDEPDSPFFLDSPEVASKLKIHRISLK